MTDAPRFTFQKREENWITYRDAKRPNGSVISRYDPHHRDWSWPTWHSDTEVGDYCHIEATGEELAKVIPREHMAALIALSIVAE